MSLQDPRYDDFRRMIEESNERERSRKPQVGGFEPIPVMPKPCNDSEHYPPNYISIPSGMQYRHRCPSCGHENVIQSTQVTFTP